jgi:hypothetical protein
MKTQYKWSAGFLCFAPGFAVVILNEGGAHGYDESKNPEDVLAKHLCGQACLQKLVDRWLNVELGNTHAAASHPG